MRCCGFEFAPVKVRNSRRCVPQRAINLDTWTDYAEIARMLILPTKALALLVTIAALAGCANDPNSKYATPARGGWDNFRADAAPGQPVRLVAYS